RMEMRVAIYTERFVAVAFLVPIAEFHTAASLGRHRSVERLGPDVLGAEVDPSGGMEQLRSRPELEVGAALLMQAVMAGVGNIWKSEVCFASRVNPFRKVGTLSIEELAALTRNARRLMSASVVEGAVVRRSVYRRRGELCRVCGTAIEARKQGE